jgi:nucleotide-binding universal stress UspA family protein
MLVCYDGSPESERTLRRALEAVAAGVHGVTVVGVAEPIHRTPPGGGLLTCRWQPRGSRVPQDRGVRYDRGGRG